MRSSYYINALEQGSICPKSNGGPSPPLPSFAPPLPSFSIFDPRQKFSVTSVGVIFNQWGLNPQPPTNRTLPLRRRNKCSRVYICHWTMGLPRCYKNGNFSILFAAFITINTRAVWTGFVACECREFCVSSSSGDRRSTSICNDRHSFKTVEIYLKTNFRWDNINLCRLIYYYFRFFRTNGHHAILISVSILTFSSLSACALFFLLCLLLHFPDNNLRSLLFCGNKHDQIDF